MNRALFLLLLLAFSAEGASPTTVSKGDLLKQRQYRSASALAYFVNGSTGNDGNGCTDASTPCLTIQGAINKIPKLLQGGGATVSVASGSYAGFYVSGFEQDFGTQQSTAGLLVTGTLTNSTLATGTATGTATAGTAGSGSTFGTLTDAAQTWTVNNLRGRLISILTGTGSGQTRVIVSNTGTAITIAGTWTSPTAGSTYAIQDSATNINTLTSNPPSALAGATANQQLVWIGANNLSTRIAPIAFQNLLFTNSSVASFRMNDASSVQCSQCQFALNSSGVLIAANNSSTQGLNGGFGNFAINDSAIIDSGTGTHFSLLGATGVGINRIVSTGGNISVNAVGAQQVGIQSSSITGISGTTGAVRCSNVAAVNLVSLIISATTRALYFFRNTSVLNWTLGMQISAGETPILFETGAQAQNPFSGTVTCSAASGAAFQIGDISSSGEPTSMAAIVSAGGTLSGCGTAVRVIGPSLAWITSSSALSGNVTTGLESNLGGTIFFANAGVSGIVASGNEVSINSGAATSTFAGISASSCLASTSNNSKVCKP